MELVVKTMKTINLLSPPANSAMVVNSVGMGTTDESNPFKKSPTNPYFRKNGLCVMTSMNPIMSEVAHILHRHHLLDNIGSLE